MKTQLTLLALLIALGTASAAKQVNLPCNLHYETTIVDTKDSGDPIEEHVSVVYNPYLKMYYYNVIIGGEKKHFRVRGSEKTNAEIERMYKDKLIFPDDGHM